MTGGSSGIGAVTAAELAGRGVKVAVTGRDATSLSRVAAVTGGPWLAGDLTERGTAAHLVDAAVTALGGLDVVVSNAGAGWAGPFADMEPDVIDRLIDLNLGSALQLARAAWPWLSASRPAAGSQPGRQEPVAWEPGRAGHLVFVGSIAGLVGVPGETVYSAAKAGLASLAQTLRSEGAPLGIRVSLVSPGAVDTAFFARRNRPYGRRWPRPVPAQRIADAIVGCLEEGRDDVVVPSWLRIPARLRGAAPGLYRVLERRFSGNPGISARGVQAAAPQSARRPR